MIKKKSSSIVISILLVMIIAGVAIGFVFIKFTNNFESFSDMKSIENKVASNELENSTINLFSEMNRIENNNTVLNKNTTISTQITSEEEAEINEYVDKICQNHRLPEFKDIEDVNKVWLYSHLEARHPEYVDEKTNTWLFPYSTKKEMEEDLKKLFDIDVVIDEQNDMEYLLQANNIDYNEENDVYEFLPYGMDLNTYYIINNIEKNDNNYIVNLVEYFETGDLYEKYTHLDGEYIIIHNYKTIYEYSNNETGVFSLDISNFNDFTEYPRLPSKTVNNEVLKRKDQFRSFDITIKKDNSGKLYITESKLVKSN